MGIHADKARLVIVRDCSSTAVSELTDQIETDFRTLELRKISKVGLCCRI